MRPPPRVVDLFEGSRARRDGIIQFGTADDRAKPSLVKGKPAARWTEVVRRSAAWAVANPTLMPPGRRRVAVRRPEIRAATS